MFGRDFSSVILCTLEILHYKSPLMHASRDGSTTFLPKFIPWLHWKWYSQLQKLRKRSSKIFEEQVFIFGIHLNVLFELRILNERNIRREHHEFSSAVLCMRGERIEAKRYVRRQAQNIKYSIKSQLKGCSTGFHKSAIVPRVLFVLVVCLQGGNKYSILFGMSLYQCLNHSILPQ